MIYIFGILTTVFAAFVMPSILLASAVTVLALLIMIPKQWLRRLLGIRVFVDIGLSTFIVTQFLLSGTYSGAVAGAFTALAISLALRGLEVLYGAEYLTLNGERGIGMFVELGRFVRYLGRYPLQWGWA